MISRFRSRPGFSLVELLVVVGIFGILAAVAIPTSVRFLPSYRMMGASNDVMTNLQKAKILAIKHNNRVVVEFTTGAFSATGEVGSYRIYFDSNADWTDKDATGADETVILPATTMPGNVSMYQAVDGTGAVVSPFSVGFDSHGLAARDAVGAFVFGNVRLRNSIDQYRRVSVSPAGHVKLEKSTDGITWQ